MLFMGLMHDREEETDASGRRSYLTVLFSDVSGSSQHAEALEAEDYAALLGRFRRFARAIIPRHGGSIARMQGDGLLALFGVEGVDESNGRQATMAALELHAAVGSLRIRPSTGEALQLHSGIHAGLLLLLEGDIERGRHDVVGEVANTAARLSSMAEAGEILVSAESLGPSEHLFECNWKRELAVRGRRSPVTAVSVRGANGLRRRIDAAARRGVVPLFGRDGVLGTLLGEAARIASAPTSPAVIHLSGEAGVGKTRLLDEFHQRLDPGGFLVVQGTCESRLSAQPLQPFLDGLALITGGAPSDAPPLAVDEAAKPGAIVARLRLLAADRPLVLILDDWQWADDASRQVLHRILAMIPRLLVVLSARRGALTDDPIAERAQLVELEPLDTPSATSAIRAWVPSADDFLVQEIVRRSGGSPLFLEELCHAAIAGSDLAPMPAERGAAWINVLVASRMARLPPMLVGYLQAASVIGNVVPHSLIVRLFGSGATASLQALAEHDFLVPLDDASMRFRHGLTRDAVYATVEPSVRMHWHLSVAQIIEAENEGRRAEESLEALAWHYHAARRSEQAAHFAAAAGDKALGANALDRARAQYLLALQALDALPVLSPQTTLLWCGIAGRLGQTCVFDPLDMNDSAPMFERAVALARETHDANVLARAEYWMAYVNYCRGRPREAIRNCRQAITHARQSGDARLEAQLHATLGQSLASAGRYDEALPTLRAAVESKRQHSRPGSGTAIGSAYSLARMAYTYGDLGRFDEAHQHFEQAFQMLGDAEHSVRASILELLCAVHLWQGRWVEAREAGFAGARVAWRCRSRYLTAMGRALGGCAAWAIERDQASYAALRDATYLIDSRGGAVSTSLTFGWLLEAATTLGLDADVRRHAVKLAQRARHQDRHGHAMGCRALAAHAASVGDLAVAARQLRRADRSAGLRGSLREQALNDVAWARLAAASGASGEASGKLDRARAAFETMRMAWHLHDADALAGELLSPIEAG